MRCVIHIDIDCFYVQVEMLRLGLPAERPVAVTQKFLVVTCNAARAAGVTIRITSYIHPRPLDERASALARRGHPM